MTLGRQVRIQDCSSAHAGSSRFLLRRAARHFRGQPELDLRVDGDSRPKPFKILQEGNCKVLSMTTIHKHAQRVRSKAGWKGGGTRCVPEASQALQWIWEAARCPQETHSNLRLACGYASLDEK